MLEIKNLNKSFNQKKIIDDLNLTVETGTVLALVGPSGGGKTTLLRCISGLETIDSGELLLDSKPVLFTENRGKIGVVFQDFNLFPHLTVLENLILAPTMVKKLSGEQATIEANQLLERFGLLEHRRYYPSQLSGGQKQRVAMVRALLMTPDVLCYDEPTSALDPDLVDNVAQTILKLKKDGMTQIVVTHDLTFAKKIADKLIEVSPITNVRDGGKEND
ncbi:polar amino acid ABC transporter ATP-binding protein [Vagococcus penaei]|uniref:Polar amino acid ABC transporter ATP-binding protein n=1 Tax=Vagococcus penaei TaxID=633807 RepID=A0A1Q2D3B1_9ENTE|nr:amino acid ABC transporter ATP-binding protein [Vagococcus penaei]AQP52818.1 polar amino acid ABC transporter ATP-binding protein [Vagococcus penaei]RSU01159.1 polar amino acid ABC transporter ATP-binding protein [Vagococcus penaei]